MTPHIPTEQGGLKENLRFVADLINRVGFPVCACVFLGWLVIVKMDEQKKVMNDVSAALNRVADELPNLRRVR